MKVHIGSRYVGNAFKISNDRLAVPFLVLIPATTAFEYKFSPNLEARVRLIANARKPSFSIVVGFMTSLV